MKLEIQWNIVIISCMPYYFLSYFFLFAHVYWETVFCFRVGDDHKIKGIYTSHCPKGQHVTGALLIRNIILLIHITVSWHALQWYLQSGQKFEIVCVPHYLFCLSINIGITEQGKVSIMHSWIFTLFDALLPALYM